MKIRCKFDEMVPVSELKPHPKNRNKHPAPQVTRLAKLISYQGVRAPLVVSKLSGYMVKGHGTLMAIKEAGGNRAPVVFQEFDDEEQEYAFLQSDNAIAEWAELDLGGINADLEGLGPDFDVDMLGLAGFEVEPADKAPKGKLSDRFMVAPYSVLNAREGWWQDRKRMWLGMGIQSELGRGENTLGLSEQTRSDGLNYYRNKNKGLLGNKSREGFGGDYDLANGESAWGGAGTSIFDPVLTELLYRWFSPTGGVVLDPFAGGSVRGVVASKLGRRYVGVELREEQVQANREQAKVLCKVAPAPVWHQGDSRFIHEHCRGVQADFLFSCPPYADLEVYSDNPADLSNKPYAEFSTLYSEIIRRSAGLLKDNRFAAFVVGEVRGSLPGSPYYGFVPDTVRAFQEAGLRFYNEAILVTPCGSLPLRSAGPFESSRKLGKTHQNILIFVKGDPKEATKACGKVTVDWGNAERDT